MVPFHVQNRGQGAGFARDMADEPARLLGRRAAVVEEVIGSTLHPRRPGSTPVAVEHRVDHIAALGRLDEGEVHPVGPRLAPVHAGLEA